MSDQLITMYTGPSLRNQNALPVQVLFDNRDFRNFEAMEPSLWRAFLKVLVIENRPRLDHRSEFVD